MNIFLFQLSVLLLTIALAYSSALSYHGPNIKKQAIYPNEGPQNLTPAVQQGVPLADQNAQLQQVQQVQETLARSIQPQQAFPAQSQPQPQQQIQQQAQPAVYATGQQQPQQYPFLKQVPYYP